MSQQPKGTTRIEEYIPDAEIAVFNGFPENPDSDFYMQTQIHCYPPYEREKQIASIQARKVGHSHKKFEHEVETYEWTSGIIRNVIPKAQPADRQRALQVVFDWLEGQTAGKAHPWASMESFMRYQHYTAHHGYDYIGSEIGANVAAYNLSIAFTRGAAKQYNARLGLGNVQAWFIDYSLWNYLGMVNYSGNPMMYQDPGWLGSDTAVSSNDYSGQSVSAVRRGYYMTYMAGAQWLINEAGGQGGFYAETEEDGHYRLSPHGEMFREFFDFVNRHPDRGVCYVPFGVVLPFAHGLPFGHWNEPKVFETFPLTAGDRMTVALFDLFFPRSWGDPTNFGTYGGRDENAQQTESPYGDTMDVLLQNAPQRVLNSYPVLILSGDLQLTAEEQARFIAYVQQGGTLVQNIAHADLLPEFDYGKGEVITYGPAYDATGLKAVLEQLCVKLIPFTVSGRVQTLYTVKDGGLVVTVINNEGIHHKYNEPVEIDETAAQTVTVTYTGDKPVMAVRDWLTDAELPAAAVQRVEIPAGGVAVLEFIL